MAIDPSSFYLVNVVDTCAVWNVLRSNLLYNAAVLANCEFAITTFVNYECLQKPRRESKSSDLELVARLRMEKTKGRFNVYSCDLDDLQVMELLENRKRLGRGEISSIAFAMRTGQAILTDDQKARRLASQAGHRAVQTTPHLFSWLIFTRRLGDSDKDVVITEHRDLDGVLEKYFEEAYSLALQYRLISSKGSIA